MLRQDAMTRTRRSVPYPGVGSRFYLPAALWEQTLAAIRRYQEYRSEGLVYWGGVVGQADETLVTSLLVLNHLPQGGRVQPTSAEMRSLLRNLRARDEKLVAQIHSHAGAAFHSVGDSQNATSFHPGFISIVVPRFGRGVTTPQDCAIYEYRGEFEKLSAREVSERFVVAPQVIELMPWREVEEEKKTLWNVLRERLRSIVRKRP